MWHITDCHIWIGCLRGRTADEFASLTERQNRSARSSRVTHYFCMLSRETEFSFYPCSLQSPVLSRELQSHNITLTHTLQLHQNRYIKNYNVRRNVEGSRLSGSRYRLCVLFLIPLRLIFLIFVLLETKTAFVTCGAALLSDVSIWMYAIQLCLRETVSQEQ